LSLVKEPGTPTSLNFVLTGVKAKFYGCVVSFYEPITINRELIEKSTKMIARFQAIYGQEDKKAGDSKDHSNVVVEKIIAALGGVNSVWHIQKCICLLSCHPYFDNFKTYMAELYRLSCSPDIFPIERYLSNLFETPFPRTEQIRSELVIGQKRIWFERPSIEDLPMTNVIFVILCFSLTIL
jgi:hypothetical protein